MTFLQSILLGLIQGVAEFLPISSSGHLAIAQNLLNINAEAPAFYDVLSHLGTLVAVFVPLAGHLRYGAGIFLRHR
ncbi:MAG: undecaprenyl-diphosphate phosphatase [Oscillospiraceae bacterium]